MGTPATTVNRTAAMTSDPDGPLVVSVRRRRIWPLVLVVLMILAGAYAGLWALQALPSALNPFGSRTTDRSSPVTVESIRDLSRFVGAEGTYQVMVDIENGRANIPSFLYGERTLLVAVGSVDASVDFTRVTEHDLRVAGDTVELSLPDPVLGPTVLDFEQTRVLARDTGLGNRIGDLFASRSNDLAPLLQAAEQKIAVAAQQSDLSARAKASITGMLTKFLNQLGYPTVTVNYGRP